MKEDAEAIKVAHQALEQVEEVVGKCKEGLKILTDNPPPYTQKEIEEEKAQLKIILELLTKEE
jgi:hypothetical protein